MDYRTSLSLKKNKNKEVLCNTIGLASQVSKVVHLCLEEKL